MIHFSLVPDKEVESQEQRGESRSYTFLAFTYIQGNFLTNSTVTKSGGDVEYLFGVYMSIKT